MHLVFDVGGTYLRTAVYDPFIQSLGKVERTKTPIRDFDQTLMAIHALGRKVMGETVPITVTIGFPGPITSNGEILAAPTIDKKLISRRLKKELVAMWPNSQVLLLNDVTSAGYFYVSKGFENFAIINVGSGIGHKIFLNGEPIIGPQGFGGEIGHLVVDKTPDALKCDCGDQGHLGAISSGRGTIAFARKYALMYPEKYKSSWVASKQPSSKSLSNTLLVEAFHRNDKWAGYVVSEASKPLAQIIATFHLALGLERFFIVGGFAKTLGERYRCNLVEGARDSAWNLGQPWEEMVNLSSVDENQVLLGAGYVNSQRSQT